MKRIWIALTLLLLTFGLCGGSQYYQHRQMSRMLEMLTALEEAHASGSPSETAQLAEAFSAEYQRITNRMDCYIAHDDLAESQETVALLPALLRQGGEEELRMEIARLREQILYLRDIDDPLLRNIL